MAPTIASAIHDNTLDKDFGYYWLSLFYVCLSLVAIGIACWLYYEDMNNNGGTLNKVYSDGETLEDLMSTPSVTRREQIEKLVNVKGSGAHLKYSMNAGERASLRRSMATRSIAK